VNDAPSFDALEGNWTAYDENPVTHGPAVQQIMASWAKNVSAGPANEAGQALNFIVSNDNHDLFAVQPAVGLDGSLTYTPLPNVHGTANVTVELQDAGGGNDTSQQVTFQIEIVKQHPLHNSAEAGARSGRDVTGATSNMPDGFIVAGDVLAVINYINAHGSGPISKDVPGPPYPDVDGDGEVVALDVLDIINYISSHPGESEAPGDAAVLIADNTAVAEILQAPTTDTDLMNLLAADTAAMQLKRRRSTS
jgi:hypothetical protein